MDSIREPTTIGLVRKNVVQSTYLGLTISKYYGPAIIYYVLTPFENNAARARRFLTIIVVPTINTITRNGGMQLRYSTY